MKHFYIIIIFCFFAFHVFSQNIATFNFSFIVNNLASYKDFKNQLDEFRKIEFEKLKLQEDLLIENKKEIEDSKLLLNETEYLNRINVFNKEKIIFENKVHKLNNFIQENINVNEDIILKEIINIVKIIATKKNIDIVFYDEQYFLSSETVDISKIIFEELSNLDISLKLSNYE